MVLSLSSRTVVVNDYHVLCCPDFPLVKQAAAFQAPSYTNIKLEKIQNNYVTISLWIDKSMGAKSNQRDHAPVTLSPRIKDRGVLSHIHLGESRDQLLTSAMAAANLSHSFAHTPNGILITLAFVRSGNVNLNSGSANNVGNNAQLWSRTSLSSTNAYNLNTNPGNVNPSNNGNRYIGRSLRCL